MPTMTAIHQDYAHHASEPPDAVIGPYVFYLVAPAIYEASGLSLPTLDTKAQQALAAEWEGEEVDEPIPRPLPPPQTQTPDTIH